MNCIKRAQLLMTATIFAVANCPARGTATEPLTVSDLVSITNFPGLTRSIAISPDGAVVAYVTETNTTDSNLLPDDWPNWGRRQLWLQKLLGGPPIRIDVPEGFEPARGPGLGWSPDGQVLVVYAHANHRGRIAAVDRDTRAVRILDVPVDPMGFDNICWWHHIQWMPEGRWFLVKRSSEDRLTAMRRTQTSKSAVAEYTSPAETDTTKSGRGAEGDTVNSGDRTDLVMVDVHTGAVKSVQKVNKLGDLSELLSPDGKKLLYVVETGPAIDDLNRYSIYVADVASGSTQMVAPDVIMSSWAQYPSWSRDSSKIAFVGNLKSDPAKLNGNQGFSGRCFVVDLRPVVVPENGIGVQHVEHVGQHRELTDRAKLEHVGGLHVERCQPRRARFEAVHRLEAGTARRRRNLAAIGIHRVGGERRQRPSRTAVESDTDAQPHRKFIIAE